MQAGSELVQFRTRFDAELRDASATLQAAPDGADALAALAECAKQVEALHGSISAAAHFLPLATREACSKATQELEARLRSERERLAPKKKFGFKNRAKLAAAPMAPPPPADAVGAVAGAASGEGAADAAGAAAAERLASTTAKHHEDSFVAVADCAGFRGQRGARLVREAAEPAETGGGGGGGGAGGGAGGDFALEGLEDCEVPSPSPSPHPHPHPHPRPHPHPHPHPRCGCSGRATRCGSDGSRGARSWRCRCLAAST